MTRTFDAGRLLTALGGLLLLISLFLDWFEADGGFGGSASAWTAFEIADLLLAAIAVAAILAALADVAPAARRAALRPGVTLGLTLAALAIVVVSVIDKPPAARGSVVGAGAWLALGAAIAMLAGELLSRQRFSLSIAPRERTPDSGGKPLGDRDTGTTNPAPAVSPEEETRTLPRN